MVCLTGYQPPAIGGDQLDGHQVITGRAIHSRQPSQAAAKRQPRDADVKPVAQHSCQTERVRRRMEFPGEQSRFRPCQAALWIQCDPLHVGQVDDQAPVAD